MNETTRLIAKAQRLYDHQQTLDETSAEWIQVNFVLGACNDWAGQKNFARAEALLDKTLESFKLTVETTTPTEPANI